jgi:hypothetical protein
VIRIGIIEPITFFGQKYDLRLDFLVAAAHHKMEKITRCKKLLLFFGAAFYHQYSEMKSLTLAGGNA